LQYFNAVNFIVFSEILELEYNEKHPFHDVGSATLSFLEVTYYNFV